MKLKPFKTDGCSVYPDRDLKECCIKHDLKYWKGGTKKQRINADKELMLCVMKRHPIQSKIMFLGTHIFGHPLLPTPFRWGFGYDYPKYYTASNRKV